MTWAADTARASSVESTPDSGSGPGGEAPAEIGEGETIGRYRIVERLGAGGMGVVYRAHDPQLDREVALKLLRAERGSHRTLAARMLREAKAAAKIRHPNVVTVHDAGEDDGRVFIAMELMRGTDLGKWFAKRHPWLEVVQVMLQAAQGLRAAHEVGLVHRDFKPDNVVLEDDGSVKVLDFGLARPAYDGETQSQVAEQLASHIASSGGDGLANLTHTGALLGTPAYMAPEQYLHEPLDARTDQFSFCVALFMGVYGHRPFGGRTHASLTMNVINGNLELPEDPDVAPADLLVVLRKGLATKPEDRFASMDELIAELRALIERASRRRSLTARIGRWLGIGLGVVLLTGGVALVTSNRDPEPTPAVEPPPAVEPDDGGDDPPSPTPPVELPVELAVGDGRTKPVAGPQIWITPDTMRVLAGPDGPQADIPMQAGRVVGSAAGGHMIPELIRVLNSARSPSSSALYDPVTLYVDRRIPFVTIEQALFNSGRVGLMHYDFAVQTDSDVRVIATKLPLYMGRDVKLRRRFALELYIRADHVEIAARTWAPDDHGIASQANRWPLDAGTGTCERPLDPSASAELPPLTGLAAELCALDGLSIPVIVGAESDVAWEPIAALLGAAIPGEACSEGVVIEAGMQPLANCATPVAITDLADELQPEPEYRRWCFINSRLKSKKVCRSTQQACIAEAKHWVSNPKKRCEGER